MAGGRVCRRAERHLGDRSRSDCCAGGFGDDGRRSRRRRSYNHRERLADFRRCDLWRAARSPEGGHSFRSPGTDSQSPLWQRHSIDYFRRPDDSAQRSSSLSGRRHGIDVTSTARDSRRALRLRPGPGQAGRQCDGGVARPVLQHADGRDR